MTNEEIIIKNYPYLSAIEKEMGFLLCLDYFELRHDAIGFLTQTAEGLGIRSRNGESPARKLFYILQDIRRGKYISIILKTKDL